MTKTFTYTGGNDIITDYDGGYIIDIGANKISGYSFDGNDLIFKISNGTLRLVDMKGRAISVKDSSGKTITKVCGTGYSGHEVIKRFVAALTKTQLTGKAKVDESIRQCSHFKDLEDVINHMVEDCREVDDADTFLKKYCGIILGNADTGAITGWDAGGLHVKTARNIIPTKTKLRNLEDYRQASFVRNNVTINLSATDDTLTAEGKKIFDGLYNWWAEGALKLIEESYGVKFRASDVINITLTSNAKYWAHTSGGKDVSINLSKIRFRNEKDYRGNGLHRTIAHEFTHIAQALFMGGFPQFLKEGLCDLTCGIDDKKPYLIKNLAGDADKLKNYLDLNKGGTGGGGYYAAGYMFYRYLAKQAADNYNNLSSYAWTDDDSIAKTYIVDDYGRQDLNNLLADTELGKNFVDDVFANNLASEFA